MKRLFSALLATVFAFSSFTLSASALESKHIKNADTSAVVEYQYVPSHFNKDAVGSIDDVIFENVADASTIAAPYSAEEPMPVLSRTYSSTSKSYLSREVWIEDTTEYLETFYGQSVSNVSEDENYITFYFSSNNSSDRAERYLNKPTIKRISSQYQWRNSKSRVFETRIFACIIDTEHKNCIYVGVERRTHKG